MNKSSRAQEPTYFTAELEFQEHSRHMLHVPYFRTKLSKTKLKAKSEDARQSILKFKIRCFASLRFENSFFFSESVCNSRNGRRAA